MLTPLLNLRITLKLSLPTPILELKHTEDESAAILYNFPRLLLRRRSAYQTMRMSRHA